jgi:putative DNA primase/helicase
LEIRRQVEERLELEASGPDKPAGSSDEKIPAAFVQDCLQANELGDGSLFAAINQGKFVFEATSGEWLSWSGHSWERDLTGRALAAVESVALCYLDVLKPITRQLSADSNEDQAASLAAQAKRLAKRIDRLRTVRGRQNCLIMAASLPILKESL